jgi:acetyl esterase
MSVPPEISDLDAGGVPVRLYRPAGEVDFAALVFLHGGGWTSGSVETTDGTCRALANGVPCAVVSVGYRLAPAHPFPAALEDAHTAARWVEREGAAFGIDPSRIAVGGASAGANLAAALTQLARTQGGPRFAFQVLAYPPTDRSATGDGGGPLTRAELDAYWSAYLADPADAANPLASPLRASSFVDLPPALVITAERDPLTPEAEEYARRLAQAGVPVDLQRFDADHGFFSSATPAGEAARRTAARALRAAFA